MTLVISQLAGNYIISVNPQQMTTTETIFQIPLMASARTFGYLKNRVPVWELLCGCYLQILLHSTTLHWCLWTYYNEK